jgi:hypothetical protein
VVKPGGAVRVVAVRVVSVLRISQTIASEPEDRDYRFRFLERLSTMVAAVGVVVLAPTPQQPPEESVEGVMGAMVNILSPPQERLIQEEAGEVQASTKRVQTQVGVPAARAS